MRSRGIRSRWQLLVAAFLAVLLGACGAKAPSSSEELHILVLHFNRQLELKAYEKALEHIHPSKRADFLRWLQETGEPTKFNEMRVRSVDVMTDEEKEALGDDVPLTATVLVSYNYFRLPSTEVRSGIMTQKWQYVSSRKRWFLMEGWQ